MLDDDINTIVANWEDLFWVAVHDFILKSIVTNKQTPQWIDVEVKALSHKKDKFSCKALRTKDQAYIDKFKSLRRDVKKLIHTKYNAYIKKMAENVETDPKFWNFNSFKTKSHKLPPAIKRDIIDPVPVTNPTDKTNLFNNYFHSVFNHDDNEPSPPGCHVPVHECLSHITVASSDVMSTLQALNPSKSSGPDGIPSRLLKELAPQISNSITVIFNKSLNNGIFPAKWKDCYLTVSNYCGIALLPILSKVLEIHF